MKTKPRPEKYRTDLRIDASPYRVAQSLTRGGAAPRQVESKKIAKRKKKSQKERRKRLSPLSH